MRFHISTKQRKPQALILTPTRELAKQVGNVFLTGLDQTSHLLHLGIEIIREFTLLLISPCLFQLIHMSRQIARQILNLF
mgnify:CR=1 FL=1